MIDVASWRALYEALARALDALGAAIEAAETNVISAGAVQNPVDSLSKCNLLPPEPVNGLSGKVLPPTPPLEAPGAGTSIAQIVRTVHSTDRSAFDLVPSTMDGLVRTRTPPLYAEHVLTAEQQNFFAEFWEAYPRHVGKRRAELAFRALNPTRQFLTVLLAAIEAHRRTRSWIEGFIPHASTWLNGQRWLDELDTEPVPISTVPPPLSRTQQRTARNRAAADAVIAAIKAEEGDV